MVCCRKVGERVGRENERREKMRWSVSTITSNNSNLGTKIDYHNPATKHLQ